ncbi:MAG: DUF1194 domain-containing protein [Hyphomicrobiaceae bacterium]
MCCIRVLLAALCAGFLIVPLQMGPRAQGLHEPAQAPSGETAPNRTEVDLLLVLAVDISRSVDEHKFRLQRDGYASALANPRVVGAIRSGLNGRIAISMIEWSGVAEQAIVADWTVIGSRGEAEALAQRIRGAPRAFMGRTAIGSAIEFATLQFPRSPWRAERHLIDVSGDGTNNSGVDVVEARQMAIAQRVTINGLAILSDEPLPFNPLHTHPPGGLLAYYENNVIGGPNAFALSAQGHEAFGTMILAKLIKEIALAD